jgi:Tol biopolymer transport system component
MSRPCDKFRNKPIKLLVATLLLIQSACTVASPPTTSPPIQLSSTPTESIQPTTSATPPITAPLPTRTLASTFIVPAPSKEPTATSWSMFELFPTTGLPSGSYIVYSDGTASFYAMSADGQIQQKIYGGPDGEISPDFKHLAYIQVDSDGQSQGIAILDLERPLNSPQLIAPNCASPNWAPDSIHLAVSCPVSKTVNSHITFGYNIFVVSINDASNDMIEDCFSEGINKHFGEFDCVIPRWSPDGKWVASYREVARSGRSAPENGLYLTDTSCLSDLNACDSKTSGPLGDFGVYAWSPDSQNLAGLLIGSYQIVIFNIKTKKSQVLVTLNDETTIDSLAWSPDGKWIAYNEVYSDPGGIFIVPSEGSEPVLLKYSGQVKFWLDVP